MTMIQRREGEHGTMEAPRRRGWAAVGFFAVLHFLCCEVPLLLLSADDGLPGGEGTFAICTFWLIQNYVLLDHLVEAEVSFQHMLSFANDVGLFAEEIDPVAGEQLGDFPQAFTQMALVNAAVCLAAA